MELNLKVCYYKRSEHFNRKITMQVILQNMILIIELVLKITLIV